MRDPHPTIPPGAETLRMTVGLSLILARSIWGGMSPKQKAALSDMHAGPLMNLRAGWGQLDQVHARATVRALVDRGLAEPVSHGTAMAITHQGRIVLRAGQGCT